MSHKYLCYITKIIFEFEFFFFYSVQMNVTRNIFYWFAKTIKIYVLITELKSGGNPKKNFPVAFHVFHFRIRLYSNNKWCTFWRYTNIGNAYAHILNKKIKTITVSGLKRINHDSCMYSNLRVRFPLKGLAYKGIKCKHFKRITLFLYLYVRITIASAF